MVRFDPTKREKEESQIELKPRKKFKTGNEAPEVSKERFYEVSDTLTAAFKEKSSGFSLLAAYGRRNEEEPEKDTEQHIETKIKPLKKINPLLVDSSDDEISENEEKPKIWAPVVHIPSGLKDNFFFSKNDSLISGNYF